MLVVLASTVLATGFALSSVEAIFAVAFHYELHKEFLREVSDAGALVFATTNTEHAGEEQPLWLSVDIDGSSLRQTLMLDDE